MFCIGMKESFYQMEEHSVNAVGGGGYWIHPFIQICSKHEGVLFTSTQLKPNLSET